MIMILEHQSNLDYETNNCIVRAGEAASWSLVVNKSKTACHVNLYYQ